MKKTLVLFVILLLVTSCGKKTTDKDIRMMHWGGAPEIKLFRKISDELYREKGITVEQERAPSGNPYMEKALTQIAGGNPPDVLFVEVNNFKKFALKGVLEDLTPYIKKDKEIKISDYYKQLIDRFTINGKLYVLPRDIAPICVIYYNKKIFDEAGIRYPDSGWDRNEFLETAKKLVKHDDKGRITQFGFVDEWPIYEAWVYSSGGRLVDNVKKPTKCVLDSKEAIDGIQFRADLINKYKVMPSPSQVVSSGNTGAYGMFMNGKVGLYYSGIWASLTFKDVRKFDWDCVMFPKGPGGELAFPTGGSGYAIVKQSKKKDAAWELVRRLSSVRGQKDLAALGLLQPAIKKLAESKVFLNGKPPKNKRIVLDAVNHIIFHPLYARWEEINISQIAPALDMVWNGKKTAAEVMPETVKVINKKFFKE